MGMSVSMGAVLRLGAVIAALPVVSVVAGAASPAAAGFEVCNDTGIARSLAIGYTANDTWTSEGWWRIEPGACKEVIKGNLTVRYVYWRATAEGETFVGENYNFCVNSYEPFTIAGDSDCEARGFTTADFRQIDTGPDAKSYTLRIDGGPPSFGQADNKEPVDNSEPVGKPAEKQPEEADAAPEVSPELLVDPAPPTADQMQPGSFGEPFKVTGLFSGCWEGAPDGCTVQAGDIGYTVNEDERTSPSLIATLKAMSPGDAVMIEGEIAAYFDTSNEVVLRSVEPLPAQPYDNLALRLAGSWVSADDAKSTMRFDEGKQYDYYEGELMGEADFAVGDTCGPSGEFNEGPLLGVTGADGETLCYDVVSLENDTLTLIYLPRGNTLTYTRPTYMEPQ